MKKILFLSGVLFFSFLQGMEKEDAPKTMGQPVSDLSQVDPAVLDFLLNEGHNVEEFLAQQNFAMNSRRESRTLYTSYQGQEEYEEKGINRASEDTRRSEVGIFFKNELTENFFLKCELLSDNYRRVGNAVSKEKNEYGYLDIAPQQVIQCCYNPLFKLRCSLSRKGNKDGPQQHTFCIWKDIVCLIRKNEDEKNVRFPFRVIMVTSGPQYNEIQQKKSLYKMIQVMNENTEKKSD